ncbi:MAG TPA: CapA family protein, partial [Kofleriaceae bacterium]|nr:CapA family protein [Kofleriaceae bacterium]
ARGDVLVATFHVTAPASYLPPREAVTAVAIARTAGAAVIVVHGSHALARVERTAGSVTAWGLGNLLFHCDCTDEEDALLLRVTVDRGGLVDASVVPIAAGLHGAAARPAGDPALLYDLLASLRSTPLAPSGPVARILPPAR